MIVTACMRATLIFASTTAPLSEGSSLAKKLVESEEKVHLVGRDETNLSELAKELEKKGYESFN